MAPSANITSSTLWVTQQATHEAFFGAEQDADTSYRQKRQERHIEELRETPVFSANVLAETLAFRPSSEQGLSNDILAQYSLIGKMMGDAHRKSTSTSPNLIAFDDEASQPATKETQSLLYANTNAPWSAFICGSQGSGKSNTLSCLLEAGLLENTNLGILDKPLTGLVFHYDQFSSADDHHICEAAYLASHEDLKVNVYVSPDNYENMKIAYEKGLDAMSKRNIRIMPLFLEDRQLSIGRMRKLMCVGEGGRPVLYLEVINRILRAMSMKDQQMQGVSYQEFLRRMSLENFNDAQREGLGHRLSLLEAFLKTEEIASSKMGRAEKKKVSEAQRQSSMARTKQLADDLKVKRASCKIAEVSFEAGSLNIVDLSSQLVDPKDACMLFNIVLGIFRQEVGKSPSIIALDEAHKYMTGAGEPDAFTESLLSVIRQQRHFATRVIIATQEPTISPALMDLSSMTIVHRFTSPRWMEALKGHLAGIAGKGDDKERISDEIFQSIVDLEKGQALLFSPSAYLDCDRSAGVGELRVKKLGTKCVKVLIRPKLTKDGGRSQRAIENH